VVETVKGCFGELGRDNLEDVVRKYFEDCCEIYFLFLLGSVEEEGLATKGIAEDVIGIYLGFLLENIFFGSVTGVVFFGYRLYLFFFLPNYMMKNVESPGEIFQPT